MEKQLKWAGYIHVLFYGVGVVFGVMAGLES